MTAKPLVSMKRLLQIAILLLTVPAWATSSLTNCQSNIGTTVTTVAVSSFVLTTVGDGIMVFTTGSATAATVFITDNGGGGSQTYTQVGANVIGTNLAVAAFLATNATSSVNGATITATWSSAITVSIIACEITQAAASSLLDGTLATASGTGVLTLTSGALTTTNSGTDLLIYCVGLSGGTMASQVPGSGYAIPSGATSTHSACQAAAFTGVQTGVTTSMSWGSSGNPAGAFFAVKQATGGGGTVNPLGLLGVGE